jgi:O-antigen/teichoic acid export membrane protein
MVAEKVEPAPVKPAAHRDTFFRQSGWLMLANIAGGLLMWVVHFLTKAKTFPASEYGVFGTLLAVAMCVPTMPMQMVMAQQTARALATHRERELAGTIRMVWLGTFLLTLLFALFLLTLLFALVVFIFRKPILERWEITNPAALWVTVGVVLLSLWTPMFWGVLQGQQNFLWLGWSMIINGIGRISIAALAVLVFAGCAAGMMTGVLLGFVFATCIGLWQTRRLWTGKALPSDWKTLLGQMVPLMLGFAAFQFLFTADTMFVKAYFSGEETAFYVSAGTLSRALMWLVGPLATVMFPRIIHSSVRSEKSNLVGVVLLGTAILAIVGAAGLSVMGPWVVKLVYKQAYVAVASKVLPWYAGAMIPLALANVLLNNLLARSAFRAVPALCILAVAYGFALNTALAHYHNLVVALQVLGGFNLLLLGICARFTWSGANKTAAPAANPVT